MAWRILRGVAVSVALLASAPPLWAAGNADDPNAPAAPESPGTSDSPACGGAERPQSLSPGSFRTFDPSYEGLETDPGDSWVRFLYTVGEDGTVRDLKVIDSFGSKAQIAELRERMARDLYKPIMRGGRPVATHGVQLDFSYRYGRKYRRNSSHAFVLASQKFNRLWKSRKEDAIAVLEEAQALPLSLKDRAILSLSLALVAKEAGDKRRALYHVRHVVADGTREFLGDKDYAEAVRWLIELEAADGNLVGAVCLNAWVQKMNVPPKAGDTTEQTVQAARARMGDRSPMAVPGLIFAQPENELGPVWVHELTRPNFSISEISGSVGAARLICNTSMQELNVGQMGRQRVPADAQVCTLFVFGTPGSTFKLTEEW